MSKLDPASILTEMCAKESQNYVARVLGVTPSYISDVRKGVRTAGPKLLAALGLRRVVSYVRLSQSKADPQTKSRAP